ncbi:alanyl-tRNA editing protein AlaXM [Ferroplasma sp.]|uniref:alanyl-tRNA editing protein AlaXM n=1 Tax=Ferroplasma sp. TaxID=2591003 RepID=UPI00307E1561
MTEKLYYKDMYGKEFDASVIAVNGNDIILDKTLFYPTSGGQPNDTGILKTGNTVINIVDVTQEDGNIIHIASDAGNIAPGDTVHGIINWENRYIHMRYHTAVHIIDGVVNNNYKNGLLTGGQIYNDHARVDFSFDIIDKELVNEIISKAQNVVDSGLNVFEREIPGKEAMKIPGLARTEPGRKLIESLPVVRIIEIENFDFQADGGTHVKNTGEVGKIEIIKIENKGKGHKRLAFMLD